MIPDPDLLARLRDLHAPPEPSWWPPAPGWWLALLLVAVLAALGLRYGPAWWRRRRLRRRLAAALAAAASAAEISQVLRLAALARFSGSDLAGLQGARWIEFLESRDRAPGRFAALGEALTETPYRAGGERADSAPLLAAARGWLREVL
jgi:Domain of unknown function (DUF4381)